MHGSLFCVVVFCVQYIAHAQLIAARGGLQQIPHMGLIDRENLFDVDTIWSDMDGPIHPSLLRGGAIPGVGGVSALGVQGLQGVGIGAVGNGLLAPAAGLSSGLSSVGVQSQLLGAQSAGIAQSSLGAGQMGRSAGLSLAGRRVGGLASTGVQAAQPQLNTLLSLPRQGQLNSGLRSRLQSSSSSRLRSSHLSQSSGTNTLSNGRRLSGLLARRGEYPDNSILNSSMLQWIVSERLYYKYVFDSSTSIS